MGGDFPTMKQSRGLLLDDRFFLIEFGLKSRNRISIVAGEEDQSAHAGRPVEEVKAFEGQSLIDVWAIHFASTQCILPHAALSRLILKTLRLHVVRSCRLRRLHSVRSH